MGHKLTRRRSLPLSSFRVWCDLREDSQALRLHPTAWEGHVIGQVGLQEETHQADPLRTWIFLYELHQSSIGHPLRNDLQRICGNADERDNVWVP